MAFLTIEGLKRQFAGGAGVNAFDLAAEAGEFITLLGPSGCGKTTVLRMVAGFERPDAGTIRVDGRDVTGLSTAQRRVGMVFQSYALFPNMTVARNIAFGLEVARRPKTEVKARVAEMLALIKLGTHAERYPYQLSGGQQQRVALARALAPQPTMLLLDEPLSALDAKIRVTLRDEIRTVQKRLGITTLFVTHDQEEALAMSDRIVVMNEGRIEQIGTPFDIYNRPRSRFVASFVGTLNLLEASVVDATHATVEGQAITVDEGFGSASPGARRTVALRPEAVSIGQGGPGMNHLAGVVETVGFQGAIVRVGVRCGTTLVSLDRLNNPGAPPPEAGTAVTVAFPRDLRVLADA